MYDSQPFPHLTCWLFGKLFVLTDTRLIICFYRDDQPQGRRGKQRRSASGTFGA